MPKNHREKSEYLGRKVPGWHFYCPFGCATLPLLGQYGSYQELQPPKMYIWQLKRCRGPKIKELIIFHAPNFHEGDVSLLKDISGGFIILWYTSLQWRSNKTTSQWHLILGWTVVVDGGSAATNASARLQVGDQQNATYTPPFVAFNICFNSIKSFMYNGIMYTYI